MINHQSYHSLLFFDVRCDQIVQEKECFRVDSDEDVILEFSDKTAFDARFFIGKIGNIGGL